MEANLSNASAGNAARRILVGRVKMAQAIKMPESEWTRAIVEIERDPLFRELLSARENGRPIVRFWPSATARLDASCYDAGDSLASTDAAREVRRSALGLIEKIGREAFERSFIFRTEAPAALASSPMSAGDAAVLDAFVLEISLAAFPAASTPIGRIVTKTGGGFSLACASPITARGLYEVDAAAFRRWRTDKGLDREAADRLKRHIGVLDLANMRQGAFWRVVELLLDVNRRYFETQDPALLTPLSLRKVAARLRFAPSTVSRVASGKFIVMPWGAVVPLSELMPGQRHAVLSIVQKLLASAGDLTDAALARRLEEEYGVKVSRRTVTACRNVLLRQSLPAQNAA